MLNELTKLAGEKSSEKRLELMNLITDMFIENLQPKSTNELELFGDVFTKLLKDMDENSKFEISTKFAPVNDTPKTFAIALIYEDAKIAAPMLEHSSVFDDDDLINVCNLTSRDHRISIAKRPNISANVTDNLIGHAETEVVRIVCQNESAYISGNGFNHMIKYHPDDGELLAMLLQRPDLPDDVKLMVPHLQGGILKKLERVANTHSKAEMQNLINRTHETRETQQKNQARLEKSSLDEVNQVRAGEISLDEAVSQFAEQQQMANVTKIISEIKGIDLSHLNFAIMHERGDPITLLCRSVELSEHAFANICDMRSTLLNLDASVKEQMMRDFKLLDPENAKMSIRHMKLKNSIRDIQN